MANVQKSQIKGCGCSNPSLLWEIDIPIMSKHINELSPLGFVQNPRYANIGILFLEAKDILITGSFGSGRLTIKCKAKDCKDSLERLEGVLKSLK